MESLKQTLGLVVDGGENYSLDDVEIYAANGGMKYQNPSGVAAVSSKDRFTGHEVAFAKQLSADAWYFAQTEPGVVGVQRDANPFFDTSGTIPKERSFEFRLSFEDRPPQYWQTVRPQSNPAWRERYEVEAKLRGFDLRFITHEYLYQDAVAYENRRRAHRYLRDHPVDEALELEQRLQRVVTLDYQSVQSVASAARADWLDVLVTCLLLSLRGALRADPASLIGPKWLVRALP